MIWGKVKVGVFLSMLEVVVFRIIFIYVDVKLMVRGL